MARDEPEDFNLTPGAWRWDGAAWVAYVKPPPTPAELVAEAGARIDQDKLLRAIALWCAGKFGLTPAQARAEIAEIYKQL